jgi:type IV pilus assembly protein PilQ
MNIKTLTALVSLSWVATIHGQAPSEQTLSLTLEDVPITTALNMIAAQNNLNLVIAGEVDGRVTLRLENVKVTTALDAILTANGFNYFLKDNVIIVKRVGSEATGELETRVVNLKYIHPSMAEKAVASLKSPRGSVAILDHVGMTEQSGSSNNTGATSSNAYFANRIVVSDYSGLVDRLVSLITEVDVPERSVVIEAKIVETTIDANKNLGMSWPSALTGTFSDDKASTSSSSTSTLTNASGTYNPNDGSWTWGKLSVGEVSMILNMLEKNGNSRLVSDPRIATLENHEAVIKFQTVIPIQTINRFTEGSSTSDIVTFQDEEIGISLRVVPRINEGGTLTLEVEPTVEDITGYVGTTNNQKPIKASRSIKTTITVNDGESVALGGLLKETEIENIERFPILGHIPLVGSFLFSSKSKEKTSTDLLILITPHIMQ